MTDQAEWKLGHRGGRELDSLALESVGVHLGGRMDSEEGVEE